MRDLIEDAPLINTRRKSPAPSGIKLGLPGQSSATCATTTALKKFAKDEIVQLTKDLWPREDRQDEKTFQHDGKSF